MEKEPGHRLRPKVVRGILHLPAALRYSFNGFRRLSKETAFRQEFVAGVLVLTAHAAFGSEHVNLVIAFILFLAVIAAESLNTAIELVVDHVSPDWSEMARQAKDLGSFAVFCLLICNGIWLAYSLVVANAVTVSTGG